MKQRTLKLLAMCLALALLGGVAATAQTLVVEDAALEEPLLPEAALDIELPGIGDFGLALDDMVSGDLVSQDIAPGGGRDVAANGIVNSGVCGPNVQWTLDSDGLLTIYGSGDMDGYYSFWEKTYGIGIRRAVVQEGVTSLAINTFNGCEELETVSLPDSLENI